MKFFVFKIQEFVLSYLGRLFGTPNHQKWVYSLKYPLVQLWTTFDIWRRRRYYLINITAQKISIENLLNDELDSSLRRIFIEAAPKGYKGVYIALEQEVQPTLDLPLEVEGGGVNIGIKADASNNFIVNVPLALQAQENLIVALVRQFKTAGKGFVVRYF